MQETLKNLSETLVLLQQKLDTELPTKEELHEVVKMIDEDLLDLKLRIVNIEQKLSIVEKRLR